MSRRDLRLSFSDAAAYSLMLGFGETYLGAFALAIGMSQVVAGLLGTIPLLLGGVLQMWAPRGIKLAGSYSRWTIVCAGIQGLSFIPVAVAAYLGHITTTLLFAITAVYFGAGMAAGPTWNNWIAAIIPRDLFDGFLAKRSRLMQLAAFVAFLGGGALLQGAKAGGSELPAFALVFAAAAVMRIVSVGCLQAQTKICLVPRELSDTALKTIIARFLEPSKGRFLLFLLVSQVCLNIASPYFVPYMLGHLQLSYGAYVALISASYLSKIAFYPWIARMVRYLGAYRTLWFTGLFVAPMPLIWYWFPYLPAICAAQVVAGFMWGGFELASTMLVFDRIPADERVRTLTVYNLANAIAVVTGSLLGASILGDADHAGYFGSFHVSAVARFLSLLVLISSRSVLTDRARRLIAVLKRGHAADAPARRHAS